MKTKINTKKILLIIFGLALLLRLFKLSEFPFGFHADEVRVGWNAYSIIKTGLDDRGNKLALYYNTFGDYRPTGIFYLTIPSILAFGKNEFAVRFPSALLGALTIFPLYLFVSELGKKEKKIALIASFLLAINPWHISVSRATSEVVIALSLALTGLYFLLKYLNKKIKKDAYLSVLFLFISYLFYHSIRVLAPLFVLTILIFKWKDISKDKIRKPAVLLFIGVFALTAFFASNKEARGRFTQVAITSDLDVQYELSRMPFEEGPNKVFIARAFHNKVFVYARRFVNEYTSYFSANFFLNPNTAKPDRYMTVGVGLLTYVEVALFVAGLIYIAQKKGSLLPILLLVVSPFPAALTTEDAPNLHRSLFMIIFITIISAYGFQFLKTVFKKYENKLTYLIIFLLALNFVFFEHMYFIHSPVHIPLYRNVGTKELAITLNEIQENYDKIILTNVPEGPYPWIAFFTGRDPATFNKDAIERIHGNWTHENFLFTGQRCPSRDAFEIPDVKRLLVVDAEGCATESNLKTRPDVKILNRILRPDESEVYILWERVVE